MWSSFYSVYIYQIITLYNFKYITILCVTYTSVNLGGVWDVSPSATYSTSWKHYYFSERVCWPFSTVCRKVFRKKRKEYSCIVCGKSIFSFKKITVIRCDCVYLTYFILSFNIQAVIDTLTTWTLFFNPSHILSFCFFFSECQEWFTNKQLLGSHELIFLLRFSFCILVV